MRHTPENITELQPNEVFCFGSNLGGWHNAGAAKLARERFGAVQGVGEGHTGQCYALPTKDRHIETRPLHEIQKSILWFVELAERYPQRTYLVTLIGCGLAGYQPDQIKALWPKTLPPNIILPKEFCHLTPEPTNG